jgi:hypothetical protein
MIALAACLATSLTGCGFIFSHAPPVGHEQMNYFNCTEGNTAPVLDLVWGGLNVLGALTAASDPDAYENSGQIMAVGFGWGVVSGLGAMSGFRKSSQCRTAKRLLADRLARPRSDAFRSPATAPHQADRHGQTSVMFLNGPAPQLRTPLERTMVPLPHPFMTSYTRRPSAR